MKDQKKSNTRALLWCLLSFALFLLLVSVLWLLSTHLKNTKKAENYIVSKENKEEKYNISEKIKQDHPYEDFLIQNAELTSYEKLSTFSAQVINQSGIDTEEKIYQVIFLNKKGQEIGTIKMVISPLKAQESNMVVTDTTLNIIDAYDFKITREKEES